MATTFTEREQAWMRRALALARRGQGRVEPNPMVGCVIVRADRVIGEGYHKRFGGPHAEVEALRDCSTSPRGATVFVTLEPCCHTGKTGPCTDVLRDARVHRVVAAIVDPAEPVAGRGVRTLRRAGIRVAVGLCADEAATLNAPYLKLRRHRRPWVILKWAQSLDGCIATRAGHSQWISSEPSRHFVHRLRGRVDAVLVGIGTALADDPDLRCRDVRPRRLATRIVVDSRLRLPIHAALVRTAKQAPTLIATTHRGVRQQARKAKRLNAAGVELLPLPQKGHHVSLHALLDTLGARQMTNVLVEGGGAILGACMDHALADEAFVFVSPRIIGGHNAVHAVAGVGPRTVETARGAKNLTVRRSGADQMFHLQWS
jgi:diaminohydroxyphosphoribosylaminopyrimidine deaminase/5-amino-6-(5-phosphoribosylamino)uracil reductase